MHSPRYTPTWIPEPSTHACLLSAEADDLDKAGDALSLEPRSIELRLRHVEPAREDDAHNTAPILDENPYTPLLSLRPRPHPHPHPHHSPKQTHAHSPKQPTPAVLLGNDQDIDNDEADHIDEQGIHQSPNKKESVDNEDKEMDTLNKMEISSSVIQRPQSTLTESLRLPLKETESSRAHRPILIGEHYYIPPQAAFSFLGAEAADSFRLHKSTTGLSEEQTECLLGSPPPQQLHLVCKKGRLTRVTLSRPPLVVADKKVNITTTCFYCNTVISIGHRRCPQCNEWLVKKGCCTIL